jgi:hypothetical protein
MDEVNSFSGVTYQVWRLSDLKLLKTANLDIGDNHYGHVSPEEPRLGPMERFTFKPSAAGLSGSAPWTKTSRRRNWFTHFQDRFAACPRLSGTIWYRVFQ